MSNAEQRQAPGKRWPLPARIYLLGAVILAAGWIAGVLIYLLAASGEAGDLAYGPGWQRQYDFQLERIGGKAAVLAAEFSQWFSDLWHGRQLAFTVAILCTGIALLCFLVARELSLAANRDD
ncbi:hypothetical protein [Cupriavidus sp. UME77]|uniref:hypothetical protein n=1 Tax=Cupriavidus sp. UME77 TaxID=1862321 RepID=UPI001603BF18|nr:hypothetical protein [Cupriavidus sp. UME77]MBB1634592.1 hypothetical protein [Cupriavidus sp. UME77]